MSDIIQLLPDSVANQIAAGEVIQRPASVIKELVENAVDAGATDIKVLVVDAGRTSIQVIDNGKGMSETDARLAFERHATSKITKAKDLFALSTMGFRGEALASVAAVAQVELKTRQANDELGTNLCIAASKVTSQEPCSCAVGSNFVVENLFFNVPARRKFLKGNNTELKNIITAFERIALVYPNVSFTLFSNGTEVLCLKAGALRQRIVDVAGKRINQFLLPVDVKTSFCTVSGFVGKPESARKKNVAQYFFVNGRYMKHPYFNKAVASAYDRLVPDGEQVPYFIYFDVPADTIDVNIHPTKTEIKFENEQEIWSILVAAVRESVGMFGEVATIDFDTLGRPDIPVFSPDDTISAPKVQYNPNYNPFNERRNVTPPSQGGADDSLLDGAAGAGSDDGLLTSSAMQPAGVSGFASATLGSSAGMIGSSAGMIDSSAGMIGSSLGSSLGASNVTGGTLHTSSVTPFEDSQSAVAPDDGQLLDSRMASGGSGFGQLLDSDAVQGFGEELSQGLGDGKSQGFDNAPNGLDNVPNGLDNGAQDFVDGLTDSSTLTSAASADTLFPTAKGADSVVAEMSPVHYQYKGRYIMTAVKAGLMIVDQHRAHVRILYEQYLERMASRHGDSQKVLFPEALHLTPGDDVVVQKIMPELEAIGFELTSLGGGSYAVNAVPAGLDGVDVQSLLHDMIGSAGENVSSVVEEIDRAMALAMARHAAIGYGCVLDNAEMENMVNSLFACSNFNYTPDGKSIFNILKQSEIEHLLG